MTIYQAYINGLHEEKVVVQPTYKRDAYGETIRPLKAAQSGLKANTWEPIVEILKNPRNHVLWTVAVAQDATVKLLFEKYGLNKYIVHESKYVTNPNYPTDGRRVKGIIMKGQA